MRLLLVVYARLVVDPLHQPRLLQELTTESEVQKACLEWLVMKGIPAWRQSNHGVYNQATGKYFFHGLRGVADILGIIPPHLSEKRAGAFLAVEVKRGSGGKLSDDQEKFLDMIAANGGIACCVHSVEELERDLAEALQAG
jgi:hypothetical protein